MFFSTAICNTRMGKVSVVVCWMSVVCECAKPAAASAAARVLRSDSSSGSSVCVCSRWESVCVIRMGVPLCMMALCKRAIVLL